MNIYLEKTNAKDFYLWLEQYIEKKKIEHAKYPHGKDDYFHLHWGNLPDEDENI